MKRLLVAVTLVAAACSGSSSETTVADTTSSLATTTTTLFETTPAPTISGAPLPPFSGDSPDPGVGAVAPSVTGVDFAGTAVSIAPSDQYTLVVFFAHWCPHCQDELEALGPYLAANPPPENTAVVAVSTGVDPEKPNFPPSEWLTPEAWPLPVLADSEDGAIAGAFGLKFYPYWVVLDPDGIVLDRAAGSLPIESVDALFQNLSLLQG